MKNIHRCPYFLYNVLDRNKFLERFTAIPGILNNIFGKNKKFSKVLEPIRAPQANTMDIHIFALLSDSYILKKSLK